MDRQEAGSRHLIIAIHGIRTYGDWQERLRLLVKEAEPTATFECVKYGRLPFVCFLWPPTRNAQRRAASDDLRRLLDGEWDRIDIVAHSFGTYVLGCLLRELARFRRKVESTMPIINTIILAGCVLGPRFDWNGILERVVKRVVNYAGTKDAVPIIAAWLPDEFGSAGRIGFQRPCGNSFFNLYPTVGHSGFFDEDFMRTYWVPLLTVDTLVELPDARPSRRFRPIVEWVEDKLSSPPKFAIHLFAFLVLAGAVIWPALVAYQRYEELPRNLQARLAERSLLLMAHDRPGEEAARLAVAAAMLGPSSRAYDALLLADSQSIPLAKTYPADGGKAVSTALSPDGRLLAIASSNRATMRVSVVRVLDRQEIASLPLDRLEARSPCSSPVALPSLKFSPKATNLMVSDSYGTCIFGIGDSSVWEMPGADRVLVDADESLAVAVRMLGVSGSDDVAIYDFATHAKYPVSGYFGRLNDVDLSSAGKIALARQSGEIDVLSVSGLVAKRCSVDDDGITAVRFAPNGQLAVGSARGRLCLLDIDADRELWHVETGSGVKHIAFSPDGTRLVAQSSSGAATTHRTVTGEREFTLGVTGYPVDIAFSGNRHIVSANRGDDIRLWSADTGRLEANLHRDVRADTLAAEGTLVAAVGQAGEVKLWDTSIANDHWSVDLGEEIREVAASPDGAVVTARGWRLAKAWDGRNGRQLAAFSPTGQLPYVSIQSMFLSPDGGVLGLGLSDGSYEFEDVRTGRVLWSSPSPSAYPLRAELGDGRKTDLVAVMPGGDPHKVAELCDGRVPVAKAGSGETTTTATVKCGAVAMTDRPVEVGAANAHFSPDGRLVAIPTGNTVYLREARTGLILATLRLGLQEWVATDAEPAIRTAGIRLMALTERNLLTITDGNIARSWDYRSPIPRVVASRVLQGGLTVVSPGSCEYIYMQSAGLVTAARVDDLTDAGSMRFEGGREFSYVVPFPDQDKRVVVVSHDQPRIYVIGEGAINVPYYIDIYDRFGGSRLMGWTIDHPAMHVVVSRDGRRIVAGDSSGVVHVYDLVPEVHTEWFLSTIPVSSVTLGPSGNSVAASVAPANTSGKLIGTTQIASRYWKFADLVQHVCRSLSTDGRDLSEFGLEIGRKISCPSTE